MSRCRIAPEATRALLPSEASTSACTASSHRISPLAIKAKVDTPEKLYEWLKRCRHCKLVNTKVPELGCEIVDVSMLKRKSEDKTYLKNDLLHCLLRRGMSLAVTTSEGNKRRKVEPASAEEEVDGGPCSASTEEVAKVVLLRQGLPKFFDIDVDKDFADSDEPSWLRKRLAERWPTNLYLLDKANGENAQVSWSGEFSAWVICSKNVSLVARELADIHRFKSDRFEYAKLVAAAWFEELQKLERIGTLETVLAVLHSVFNHDRPKIRKILSHHTLVGELCGRSGVQHIVKYNSQGLKWYALVANVCGAESACVAPADTLTILKACGLTTIEEVCPAKAVELREGDWDSMRNEIAAVNQSEMHDVTTLEHLIRCQREGVVAYFENRRAEGDGAVVVVALGKAKTAQYRLLRKLREVTKQATRKRQDVKVFKQPCEMMLSGNARKDELLALFLDLFRRVQYVVREDIDGFGAFEAVDQRFPELLALAARTEVVQDATDAAGRVIVIHSPPGSVPKGMVTDDFVLHPDKVRKMLVRGSHVVQLPNILQLKGLSKLLRHRVKVIRYGWDGQVGDVLNRTLERGKGEDLYETDKRFFGSPIDKQCALIGKWYETLGKIAIPGVQQTSVGTEEELRAAVEKLLSGEFEESEGAGEAQRVFVVAPIGVPGSGKTRLLKEVFAKLAVAHGKYRQNLVEEKSETAAGANVWDALYLSSDNFAGKGRADQRRQNMAMRRASEAFSRESIGRAPEGSTHVVLVDKNHIHTGDLRGSASPFMKANAQVKVIALFLADTDDVAGEEKVWNYPWSPKTMAVCLKRVLERDAHPTLGSAANDDRKKASVFLKFWRLFERHRGLEESNLVSSVLVLPIVGGGRWKEDGTGLAKEILASDIDSDESGEKVLEKVKKLVAMLECGEESSAEFDKCVDLVVQKVRTLASAPLASRALPPRTLTAPTPPFQLRCPLYVGVEISGGM
ncbi:hypothetical protein FOZ62_007535 [Perkinsus olseni]|uniref:Uncharacterized protein n=1 Tax=Perkinsus olseni TaxID=32597 RepID=A0A7J6S3L1_PEROL|nr:hypothetical protein FOZ62_007535 [Perkinsus olseni]